MHKQPNNKLEYLPNLMGCHYRKLLLHECCWQMTWKWSDHICRKYECNIDDMSQNSLASSYAMMFVWETNWSQESFQFSFLKHENLSFHLFHYKKEAQQMFTSKDCSNPHQFSFLINIWNNFECYSNISKIQITPQNT